MDGRLAHRTVMLGLIALGCWCVFASCAAPVVRADADPNEVLEAWTRALEANQPKAAWACLAPSAREGLSERAFVEFYAHHGDELVARARQLLTWARLHPAAERAEVAVGEQRLGLVRTRAGWRILGSGREAPAAPSSEVSEQ